MIVLARLRERWGGGIRPSFDLRHDEAGSSRWDGEGEGPGWALTFEGFGISGCLFIGRTPPRRP